MTDFQDALGKGFMVKAPSFASTFRYLEDASLTDTLNGLVELSAAPMSAIETDFAVDSSGFGTTTYDRWYDHKWGKEQSRNRFIKTHIICGVKTHIVTSARVDATETSDNLQLPALVNVTARTFQIAEVSGDKAYSGRTNLHAVDAIGGVPYIPFMSNATGGTSGKHPKFDGLWNRSYHYYNYNRAEFLEHYHKRSNVETTFSMIKSKFGASVRAKITTAQINGFCSFLVDAHILPLYTHLTTNGRWDMDRDALDIAIRRAGNDTPFPGHLDSKTQREWFRSLSISIKENLVPLIEQWEMAAENRGKRMP